jgi:hypothetical protein
MYANLGPVLSRVAIVMQKCIFAVFLTVLLPSLCMAGNAVAPVEKPVVAQTLESFDQEATAVRQGLEPGGVYEFMKPTDKTRVEARLNEMRQLLQGHSTQGELSQQEKQTLFNTQEEVNAVLLHNDNNRLICETAAPPGSRIKVNTCHTYGELMERQEKDRRALGDTQRQPQNQRSGQ